MTTLLDFPLEIEVLDVNRPERRLPRSGLDQTTLQNAVLGLQLLSHAAVLVLLTRTTGARIVAANSPTAIADRFHRLT